MKRAELFFYAISVLLVSCVQNPAEYEAVIAPAPEVGTGIHNGDIGLKVWGPNNRITLSIGKSDVWDRRRFQQEPLLTLAEIKSRATCYYASHVSTSPGTMTDFYCAQDATPWHGDFHFDEQQYSRHYFILNEEEKLEPCFQLIEKMLPLARKNAAEVYNSPGCVYPIVRYPIRTDRVFNVNVIWDQIMEITALNMKPFWEHYLYTGDKEFLQTRTYNLLREGARFYTSYLTLEEDGCYHVFPTISPEHWGLTRNFERNKDSQSALTLIKYHLRAASQAAEILDEDQEERERWKHISDHMAPYPTYDTTEGPIFVDVLGAPPISYNIPVPLTAIFWGDDITPESPPEVLAVARRTIQHIEAHRYVDLSLCLLGEYPEGSNVGPENLLQSRGGWIRVFPAVPENYSGSFRNYRAIGAFEVSAVSEDGHVTELRIFSHSGNLCQLINPWPDQEILVREEGESEKVIRFRGSHNRFPTQSGNWYRIEPARDYKQFTHEGFNDKLLCKN